MSHRACHDVIESTAFGTPIIEAVKDLKWSGRLGGHRSPKAFGLHRLFSSITCTAKWASSVLSLRSSFARARPDPTETSDSNLFVNPAKYTDPGGRIGLTALPDGEDIVVRVRDNGIGTDVSDSSAGPGQESKFVVRQPRITSTENHHGTVCTDKPAAESASCRVDADVPYHAGKTA
jgi:hypothetical protein